MSKINLSTGSREIISEIEADARSVAMSYGHTAEEWEWFARDYSADIMAEEAAFWADASKVAALDAAMLAREEAEMAIMAEGDEYPW